MMWFFVERVPTMEINREIFLQTLKLLLFLKGTPDISDKFQFALAKAF